MPAQAAIFIKLPSIPPAENTAWWCTVWNFLTSLAGIVHTMVLTAALVYLTYLLVLKH